MSGHRVEVIVSFHVGSEEGRKDAEAVLRNLEDVGETSRNLGYASDFTVTPRTVDGNGWYEKWPNRKTEPVSEPVSEPVQLRERELDERLDYIALSLLKCARRIERANPDVHQALIVHIIALRAEAARARNESWRICGQ